MKDYGAHVYEQYAKGLLMSLQNEVTRLQRKASAYKRQTITWRDLNYQITERLERIKDIENTLHGKEQVAKYRRMLKRYAGWVDEEPEYRDRLQRSDLHPFMKAGLTANSIDRQERIRQAIRDMNNGTK